MNKSNEIVECWECGTRKFRSRMHETEVYDSPFDEIPRTIYHCKVMPKWFKDQYTFYYRESCIELLDNIGWADFRYFTCAHCGRWICRQNSRNGWHSQVRVINECEEICLKCYEEHILENGIDRQELEEGHLPGMFFSGDNHEPLNAGYETILYDVHIDSEARAKEVIDKALELINSGHKVIIGYERLAIGGLEGYVTLFSKEVEN